MQTIPTYEPPRKRKREEDEVDYQDQRQKGYAAKEALDLAIHDVFEAVESYKTDSYSSEYVEYFHQSTLLSDVEIPVLSKSALSRIDALLRKCIDSSGFKNVSSGKVAQLQKLLESTVTCVTRMSFMLDGEPSESELEEWSQALDLASTALQAMKVLLRTMTAKREEKELYSEEILGNSIASLEHIIESCVIPVVEARTSTSTFKAFGTKKKELSDLIVQSQRVLLPLGKLVANVDISDSAVVKVEFLSRRLIFIENAHAEKESVLGIQRYESMRRAAMDALASIFARYPEQRVSIIDEILLSLEKLPSTRQSARQYKLVDGGSMQLVSALLMRLVQTSAMWTGLEVVKKPTRRPKKKKKYDSDEDEKPESEDEAPPEEATRVLHMPPIDMDEADRYTSEDAVEELRRVSSSLWDSAVKNAKHVINFLLNRAISSTKSSDQPYRALLDIFTEDFLSVLGLPEWPAAELLLRSMFAVLHNILMDDKRPVPQKNLALDLMTIMGLRISDIHLHARAAARNLENLQTPIADGLLNLLNDDGLTSMDLVKDSGPYRIVFEHLCSRPGEAQADSASGFTLVQWADLCLAAAESEDVPIKKKVLLQLRNTIPDHTWLGNHYQFAHVDQQLARHAANTIAVASQFCKYQPMIIKDLMISIGSSHPQLKSKSLKSIPQLLEKDPGILDRYNNVLQSIIKCCEDQSPMVRQSALTLLEKCTELKPALVAKSYPRVILLLSDDNVGVRKRAMKVLHDFYNRNDHEMMRAQIAHAFLGRTKDHEESVAELARQNLESRWFMPFYTVGTSGSSIQDKIKLEKQIKHIVLTTSCTDQVSTLIEDFLRLSLDPTAKHAKANLGVCDLIIKALFDAVIENTSSTKDAKIDANEEAERDPFAQDRIAMTLAIFAKVCPQLFNAQQLQLLSPYVSNIDQCDNLLMYRATVIIFRYTMPALSSVQHDFIRTTQLSLMKALSRLPPSEILDTAECLWNFRVTLNDLGRGVVFMKSLILQMKEYNQRDPKTLVDGERLKITRYINLAGPFGKVFDFEPALSTFKQAFKWNNDSVASLIVDQLYLYTNTKHDVAIRRAALRSMGQICHSWPRQYLRNDVTAAFKLVFLNDNVELQSMVLEGFMLFFNQEEKRSESGSEIKVGKGAVHGQERLAKSFVANDNDGAVTTIAQTFLEQILRIALATTDNIALSATQVIASINRQGLVHPKESGPALVALETSTNKEIANIALQAHQAIHSKHESMFEKEYMKAVSEAFAYQRDIIGDPRGIVEQPSYAPKLRPLFDVLKLGNNKVRKRFLANICGRLKFELRKLDVSGDIPNVLLFTRFVVENLAFFDYARIDELLHLVKTLEDLVVSGIGASVAHTIETEMLEVKLEPTEETNGTGTGDVDMTNSAISYVSPPMVAPTNTPNDEVDPTRNRQLAVASMILTMIWECRTHLRTIWGLQKSKVKLTPKDFNRAPTRVPFISSERVVEKIKITMQALATPEAQMSVIKSFAELVAVDSELKINAEEDEDGFDGLAAKAGGYETPSEGEGDAVAGSAAKAKKRGRPPGGGGTTPTAKRVRKSGTPSKKGPGRPRKKSRSASLDDDDDADWD